MTGARYGLAVEGWPLVLLLAAASAWLVVGPQPVLALLPALLMLIAVLKFRDPPRTVPADPLGVISPVDGRVAAVSHNAEAVHVLIRVDFFSPYLLRSPTEGKVLESGAERGGHGMRIRTDEGEEVFLRLRGPRWLAPSSGIDYGERVGQGQRCGLLRMARAAELWLPADAELVVQRGERVRAGESVLGRLRRNGAPAEREPA